MSKTMTIAGFDSRFDQVGSVKLHYWLGGDPAGQPVPLWYGFLATSGAMATPTSPLVLRAMTCVRLPRNSGSGRRARVRRTAAVAYRRPRHGRTACAALGGLRFRIARSLSGGSLWLQKHACHVAARWAFIPDQPRLTCQRRDPRHLDHYGFASRTGKAAFRKV